MEFNDIVSKLDLQAYFKNYVDEQNTTVPTLGEQLFPSRKDDVVDLRYIIGANDVPVRASIRAIDSETQIGGRQVAGKSFESEIPLVARKLPMTEQQRLDLMRLSSLREAKPFLDKFYGDAEKLAKSVQVAIEAMRFEALFNGKIEFNEYGYAGTVDYQVPTKHQVKPSTLWDATGAKVLEDIEGWKTALTKVGVRASVILTSSTVLSAILSNPAVKTGVFGKSNEGRIIGINQLNEWLTLVGLPTIWVNDDVYAVEKNDGTVEYKRYIPENKLVVLGAGTPGYTQFGLTPEEVELRAEAGVSTQNFGNVIVTSWTDKDPVTRWTKATARALPSFTSAGRVIQAEVLAPSV